MQTEVGYIQAKDYLPKPEPFYHIPKPVLVGDIWKLDWEENEELKAAYEEAQKKEIIKSELDKIYKEQDKLLQSQFESTKNAITKAFNDGDEASILEIFNSPFMDEKVKPIAEMIYNRYIELKTLSIGN